MQVRELELKALMMLADNKATTVTIKRDVFISQSSRLPTKGDDLLCNGENDEARKLKQ